LSCSATDVMQGVFGPAYVCNGFELVTRRTCMRSTLLYIVRVAYV